MSRTADLRGLAREAREGILTSIAALAQPLVVGSSVEAEHLLGLYQALSALQALDDELDVSQPLLTTFLALMAIPIFMIVLSATLPARANRLTNLVVASVQIPYAAFNLVGESWTYYYGLGVVLELVLFALILRYAWTWPRTAPSATTAFTPHRRAPRAEAQA